jgi:bifunctional DNase/RNase
VHHDRQGPRITYLYIARRVWQRLLVALYTHRTVVLGIVITLLVLGLFWLRAAFQGQASAIGTLPIAVSVHALEPRGDAVALVLKEQNGPRALAVDLPLTEVRVIAVHQGVQLPGEQPQVYDLFQEIVQQLDARVDHVLVSDVSEDIYTAQIVLSIGSDTRVLRAKAADAATLALKTGAQIFVENDVLDGHGSARGFY